MLLPCCSTNPRCPYTVICARASSSAANSSSVSDIIPCSQIFKNALLVFRARNRHNIRIFMQHPAQRNLCHCHILALCIASQKFKNRLICFHILFAQLRYKFSHIITVGKSEFTVTLPDKKPLAIGEKGTTPILCSMQYGITSSSTPRSSMEYIF